MKRVPLTRTAPLRRTQKAAFKRTALRPVSARRKRENTLRRKNLIEAYGPNPACARCGSPAVDAHELVPRSAGGSITNPANCRPVCRTCHSEIHSNPAAAAADGWLIAA